MKKVFIAHAKADGAAVANRLHAKLTAHNFEAFLDSEALQKGEAYDLEIRDQIGRADLFVFLLTPNAVEKGAYPLTEVKLARQRWKNPSGRVLVVELAAVDRGAIPEYLQSVVKLPPAGDAAAEALIEIDRMAKQLQEPPEPRKPPRSAKGRRKPPPPADPDEDPRWLRGAKTALSDGLGIYLVSMLLLGVVAALLHQAVRPNRDEREALRNLVETEQEPYRPETLPTLVATLVTSTWDACSDKAAIGVIRECHQLFEHLFRGENADKSTMPLLAARLPESSFVPQKTQRDLTPCPPEDKKSDDTPKSNALTEEGSRSLLRVPSGVAQAYSASTDAAPAPGEKCPRRAPDPLQEIADRSREIEALDAALGYQLDGGAHIAAMYFVSSEGVLRMIPGESPSWPHYRVFNGASYVYRALEGGTSDCGQTTLSITHPYLDLAGSGVVTTLCAPVRETDKRLAGVFCVDVAHGRKAILDELENRASLFPLTLARVGAFSDNATSTAVCGSPEYPAPAQCPLKLATTSKHEQDRARDAALEWRRKFGSDAGGAAKIYKTDNHEFVAGIIRSHEWYEVVVIDTTPSNTRSLWWLVGAIGLLVITGGLVIVGRVTRDRRREATLIRGLQMGVIRTNEDDEIVGVNDRALEILNRDDLPRLGLYSFRHPRGKRVKFEDLLGDDHTIVMVNEHNGELERKAYRRLNAMRQSGIASRYWFKRNDRWIRVYGSPIALPKGSTHTFGLLDWETNESMIDKLRAKSS